MKLLIASDIHGSAFWCRRLCDLMETERPDRLILLGDLLYHGPLERPAPGLRAEAGDSHAERLPEQYHCGAGQLRGGG